MQRGVYLQHHKDQLEVFIWVKNSFKKFLCQKINILAFFTKNVPMNSQAFLGKRICDKNNLSTRAHHLITLKFEEISFEPEKNGKEKWCKIFGVQYITGLEIIKLFFSWTQFHSACILNCSLNSKMAIINGIFMFISSKSVHLMGAQWPGG